MKISNVNINQQCKVRLTQHGVAVWQRYYLELFQREDLAYRRFNAVYRPDKDGYVTFQLHELFGIFGHCYLFMQNGEIQPFVNNEIVILPRTF